MMLDRKEQDEMEMVKRFHPHLTPVAILGSPVSERMWHPGRLGVLSADRRHIRIGGCWFDFDDRWTVEEL